LLQMADRCWRAEENVVRLGEVYAFRAHLAMRRGRQEQMVAYASQALRWLPLESQHWRVWLWHQGERVSTLDLYGGNFVLLAGPKGERWKELWGEVASRAGIPIGRGGAGEAGWFYCVAC
jgi:hypothetical protein